MTPASPTISQYHLGVASEAEVPQEAARRPPRLVAAVTVLVIGVAGLVVCVTGAALQVLPRRFTAAQQQAIISWEVSARWRQLRAGDIFHTSVGYQPTSLLDDGTADTLSVSAHRVGIAPQSSCDGALDTQVAAVLAKHGCQAVLRATYADTTDTYVVTVGVAVLSNGVSAREAVSALPAAGRVSGVRTAMFPGTVAGEFTDARRQLSADFSAGPYVVLYTVGYSDDRPVLPVSGDQYESAEMTTMASGVAHSVADTLAASPAVPHCPGAPGC